MDRGDPTSGPHGRFAFSSRPSGEPVTQIGPKPCFAGKGLPPNERDGKASAEFSNSPRPQVRGPSARFVKGWETVLSQRAVHRCPLPPGEGAPRRRLRGEVTGAVIDPPHPAVPPAFSLREKEESTLLPGEKCPQRRLRGRGGCLGHAHGPHPAFSPIRAGALSQAGPEHHRSQRSERRLVSADTNRSIHGT